MERLHVLRVDKPGPSNRRKSGPQGVYGTTIKSRLAFCLRIEGRIADVTPDTPVQLDALDKHILEVLQVDGRISWRELGGQVGLSAPAVADRVRALERSGVISGYGAVVDPARVGLSIDAIIRVNARGFSTDLKAEELPEVLECERVTGTDSHVIRAVVRSTSHLEELLQALWDDEANTVTNIVTSTPVPRRPIAIRQLLT